MSNENEVKKPSGRADWVERHLKRKLSQFQRDCVDLICDAQNCGPYDFARTFETAEWSHDNYLRFVIRPLRLATVDYWGLTRLVIGAHEDCIRVEIMPVNFQHIAVVMHKRYARTGPLHSRHPTIETAIETERACR